MVMETGALCKILISHINEISGVHILKPIRIIGGAWLLMFLDGITLV